MKTYKCPACPDRYEEWSRLVSHIRWEHTEKETMDEPPSHGRPLD